MKWRGIFVSGTDTGVGKTTLTAVLLAAARLAGQNWVAAKPVQTGVRPPSGKLRRPVGDLARVARAAAWRPSPAVLTGLLQHVFTPPCSPHRAAELAGRRLSAAVIARRLRRSARGADGLLVEGAGGLYVPLNNRETMLDLIAHLELPVLLAIRPGLGTLNHTLLSCAALRAHGIPLLGCVAVQSSAGHWTSLMRHNLDTLRRRGVPVLGRLPFLPNFARAPRTAVLRALRSPSLCWVWTLLERLRDRH
ncbi:MAG: dethiobiotin synthase [Kiritimatiellae bacterium]|nr:dethiobiotin synthase [Kiritimatiellia bacterium]